MKTTLFVIALLITGCTSYGDENRPPKEDDSIGYTGDQGSTPSSFPDDAEVEDTDDDVTDTGDDTTDDVDADGDGWTVAEGDCDDGWAGTNPGADEWCDDGSDNDCDGDTDESDCVGGDTGDVDTGDTDVEDEILELCLGDFWSQVVSVKLYAWNSTTWDDSRWFEEGEEVIDAEISDPAATLCGEFPEADADDTVELNGYVTLSDGSVQWLVPSDWFAYADAFVRNGDQECVIVDNGAGGGEFECAVSHSP